MMSKNETRIFFLTVLLLHYLIANSQVTHPDYNLPVFKSGFSSPLGIENAGDGSNRLFIVEQAGRIKIIKNGNTLSTPFLDISSIVLSGGERGLLGLAFHPDFANNGYFYVNYTKAGGHTQISRFSVSSNPDVADPNSEISILSVNQPQSNHNGGDLNFGPDGYLYIGFGDGGGSGDPNNLAQNKKTFLGKMLRIDVDSGSPYSIPASNPFVSDTSTLDEIWAIGLRNPWRFSFDRLTGDLWIGDVGQNKREEINFQPASSSGGENYGWKCYEGDIAFNTTNCGPMNTYTFPVFAEVHNDNNPNSIAGGMVYRGSNECFQGVYFCGETRADTFFTIIPDNGGWSVERKLFPGINNIAGFGEDEAGELYAVSLNGIIYQVKGDEDMVNGTPISPGVYSNNGSILVAGTVETGTVDIRAPEYVQINPTFEVTSGANFFITLGCDL